MLLGCSWKEVGDLGLLDSLTDGFPMVDENVQYLHRPDSKDVDCLVEERREVGGKVCILNMPWEDV